MYNLCDLYNTEHTSLPLCVYTGILYILMENN